MTKAAAADIQMFKLFNEFRDAVIITGKDKIIRNINSAGLQLFKVTSKKAIGQNCCQFIYGTTLLCENCPFSALDIENNEKFEIPEKKIGERIYQLELFKFNSNSEDGWLLAHIFKAGSYQKRFEPTAYLKSNYSSAPLCIGIVKNGVLHNLSQSIVELTGYPIELLEGKESRILFYSEEEYKRVIDQVQVAAGCQSAYSFETQWKSRDGVIKDILLSLCPIDPALPEEGTTFTALEISNRKQQDLKLRNHEDTIRKIQTGISGKVGEPFFETMVTEQRMNTEKELATSEQKYRLLFNQMSGGLTFNRIILDEQGHGIDFEILESNPSFERITGLKSSLIIGRRASEVLPFLDISISRLCGRVALGGQPAHFEYFHQSLGKQLEISVYSPENGYFAAIYNDISVRKKAEDNLKQERDFNALISHTSPVGIVYFNIDGIIIFANPLAEKILSISADPVTGQHHASIDSKIRDFAGRPFDEDQSPFYAVKHLCKSVYGVSISIDRNEKERVYLSVNASPIFLPGGEFNGALATFDDITKEVHAEMELIRAKEKAIESDKLKSAFLANISHEIRTPMNGIMGFSSLLDSANLDHSKRQVYTNIIRERCRDLLHIVDDLLDLSKIESGYIDLFPTRFGLNHLMDDLELQYSQKLKLEGKFQIDLKLEKELKDGKETITTDESRLRQVMCNLLDNALKFTEIGFIHFGYKIYKAEIQIYVEDSGIGVPADKVNVIFERFRQAEESLSKNYGGAGLGLAISKSLVELMGGRIWINSEPAKGSKFIFTLPSSILAHTDLINDTIKHESTLTWSEKKIMVVEDDQFSRLYMEELFSSQGMNCFYANTGKAALEIFRSEPMIDLILMDIRLPDINGLEITKIIKSKNPKLPIIALTAYAMEDDKRRCMEAGCDDYISKPVFKEPLIEKINQYLNKENFIES